MATVVRREIRKRGFFGWLFLTLFVVFNLLMLFWLMSYWGDISAMNVSGQAAETGRAIGVGIGTGVLLFFWVAGAVILGLFALLMRGRKTIIENVED